MIIILIILLISSCSRINDSEILSDYKYAGTLYIKNKHTEALAVLMKIEEKNPEYLPALYLSGKIYFLFNNSDKAEEQFNKIISISPYHIQAGKQLVKLYISRKEFIKAENILSRFTEYSPGDPELLILAGKMRKSEKRYLEAIEYYNKAFLFEDWIIDAHIDAAEIYQKYGITSKSRSHLEKAASIGGEDHELYEPVMSIVENIE